MKSHFFLRKVYPDPVIAPPLVSGFAHNSFYQTRMPAQNLPHPSDPGDRVVAIDTRQAPLLWEDPRDKNLIATPDGLPRKGVVYYVEGIMHSQCGSPGVIITRLRSYWKNLDLPWCASRFRKVDTLKGHAPKKRRRKQPAPQQLVAR
jgi:hypothetical protein